MHSIVMMNAKGGVGKSTLTMALAETLAAFHGKRVLLVDADGQMSLSLMAMPVEQLNEMRSRRATLPGFLSGLMPGSDLPDWRTCVATQISDVDDAENLAIMPSDMNLTLIERDLVATASVDRMYDACRQLIDEALDYVDFVIVDCAPGISVVTECWLRICNWHLIPVRPDILALSGVQYLKTFRQRDPQGEFAQHLGVVLNMKEAGSEMDRLLEEAIKADAALACFDTAIPMIAHIQRAALYVRGKRSFYSKYPAEAGRALRSLAQEILHRVEPRE